MFLRKKKSSIKAIRHKSFIYCVHIHIHMGTKTISVTDDAYEELKALKIGEESFSDAIKRLSQAKGNLKDCLGLWKDLTKEERGTIEKAVSAGRQTTQKILRKLHGNTA